MSPDLSAGQHRTVLPTAHVTETNMPPRKPGETRLTVALSAHLGFGLPIAFCAVLALAAHGGHLGAGTAAVVWAASAAANRSYLSYRRFKA
jgi:hypothetical protein